MKKILILSDTHMPRFGKTIPKIIIEYLNDVDLIIHAGDFQTYEVYQAFNQYKKIIGVYGNNDDTRLVDLLPRKIITQVESIKIGITHGHGLAFGINKGVNTINRTVNEFTNDQVNLVIFGHSHIPYKEKINDVMYFNPGSPTNKRRQKQYSFGLIEIRDNHFEIEHIFYDDKN